MKDLLYVLKFFGSLPFWLRTIIYLLLSATVVAIAGYWGKHAAVIAAIVCAVLAVLLITFSRLSQWVRERKAQELRGEGLDFGIPSTLVDTDLLERISNLRREFANGIHKFQVFGKNVYEMPWYIMIGEHGSGKSEAVLHSKVDLPRDLQNKAQESLGSSHLNWWFTNYGVLLDTSGDIIFRSEDSGVTPEWSEFLELLKKHRPDCPSNGIIIALPVDSLLNDSPKEIDRKAGIVARHLDKLQEAFGVKIPAYVIVTKCDLLTGFLPFFNGIKDPKLQQQMLGWSNPAPLEAPFRPELFEDSMLSIVQRLRRLRLELLGSTVPQRGAPRRADEVDELYALPESVQQLVTPLRAFLEDVFISRQWVMSPLFLRGVYFTSACPSEADDANPAETSTEAAKSTEVSWYNKTSYFLREVFLAKIFREDGLVTITGTDRQRNLRFRTIAFLTGIALLVVLVIQFATSFEALRRTIHPQLKYWKRAAVGWDSNGYFSPIVVPGPRTGHSYLYQGNSLIGAGPGKSTSPGVQSVEEMTVNGFLEKLAVLSSELPSSTFLSWHPFSSMLFNHGKQRYQAQRVVFEASVVKPLLDATRARIAHGTVTDNPKAPRLKTATPNQTGSLETREARALLELIIVESEIVQRRDGNTNAPPGITYIPSLLDYTSKTNSPELVSLMNWTYGVNPAGKNQWPPDWMSGGNSLTSNKAISEGLEHLVKNCQEELDRFDKNMALIQKLADAATAYADSEAKLSTATSVKADNDSTDSAVRAAYENLKTDKVSMEQNINLVRASGLFGDGPETLTSAVNRLKQGNASYFGVVSNIMAAINQVLPPAVQSNGISSLSTLANQATAVVPSASGVSSALQAATNIASQHPFAASKKYQLFQQIQEKLSGIRSLIAEKVDLAINDKLLASYQSLDQNLLDPYGKEPSYLWRWRYYKECAAPSMSLGFSESMYLVDQRWSQLGQLISSLQEIFTRVDDYAGPLNQAFQATCTYFLQSYKRQQTQLFVANYVKQAKDALKRVARFPLVYPPGPGTQSLDFNQLVAARGLLDAISLDLSSSVFTSLTKAEQKPATDFAAKIAPLYSVVDALILPNGTPSRVSVTLFNGQAQKQLSGPNYAPLPTPTPTPTPPPRSAMSKLFFDMGSGSTPPPPPQAVTVSTMNWNAVQLIGEGGGGVYPLDSQTDINLGTFSIQDPFSFQVYHSLVASDGTEMVDGGDNWSALRLIAKLGGVKVGVGQEWRVPLMPDQAHGVWLRFSFELPLPATPWPTIDSIGLRSINGQ